MNIKAANQVMKEIERLRVIKSTLLKKNDKLGHGTNYWTNQVEAKEYLLCSRKIRKLIQVYSRLVDNYVK